MELANKLNQQIDRKLTPDNETKRYDKAIKKLDKLFDKYVSYRMAEQMDHHPHENLNKDMQEIKTEAERIQQIVIDEGSKKRISDLIQYCNEAMYSHKFSIEHDQFIVLETFDAKKKFVLIDTSFGHGHNDHRIVACEYDDAIKNREVVLKYDYLVSIRVSRETYYEASRLIDQVRKNSGESTLLYGHKELYTTATWVDYRT
jgi:hypothetical protein